MILALKTAGDTTEAWLYTDHSSTTATASLRWESGRILSDELLSRLTDLLYAQEKSFPDLTGIIIFSGPGSFTSLRIGHTVANALADSLGIPVVGTTGDKWLEHGLAQVEKTPPGRPALPHYGAEAHITKPKSRS